MATISVRTCIRICVHTCVNGQLENTNYANPLLRILMQYSHYYHCYNTNIDLQKRVTVHNTAHINVAINSQNLINISYLLLIRRI